MSNEELLTIGVSLLISILSAIIGYLLVPLLFAICRVKLSHKGIITTLIINACVVFTIFFIINIVLDSEPNLNPTPAFIWSGIGYLIMRKACLKKTPKPTPVQPQYYYNNVPVYTINNQQNYPKYNQQGYPQNYPQGYPQNQSIQPPPYTAPIPPKDKE